MWSGYDYNTIKRITNIDISEILERLWNGNIQRINSYILHLIMSNLNEYGINTLKIQQNIDKTYCIKTDKLTVDTYRAYQNYLSEMEDFRNE